MRLVEFSSVRKITFIIVSVTTLVLINLIQNEPYGIFWWRAIYLNYKRVAEKIVYHYYRGRQLCILFWFKSAHKIYIKMFKWTLKLLMHFKMKTKKLIFWDIQKYFDHLFLFLFFLKNNLLKKYDFPNATTGVDGRICNPFVSHQQGTWHFDRNVFLDTDGPPCGLCALMNYYQSVRKLHRA